jgi:imidazolonepropionase-like amidohydrolase
MRPPEVPMNRRRVELAALVLSFTAAAVPAAPPEVHALTGARVVIAPGRVLPSATVVVRDGVIAAVGADAAIPPEARLWDLKGKTLYPGLIEPWLVRSWPLEKPEERPQTVAANALVRPERSIAERPRDEKAWSDLRAAGFTTALVVPSDGILRGRAALLTLGDDPRRSMLRADAAQVVALRSPRGWDGYPESVMGAVALFRQSILDARWARKASAAYRANPAQERPAFDASLEALQPAAHGEQPVVFETESSLELLRVAAIADELDLKAMAVGHGREYQRLAELRAHPLPLFLPLDFPETPKVGEVDDLSVSLEDLRHWDAAAANPATLHSQKVPFALTSFRQKEPKQLWKAIETAIERGLPRDAALAALTQVPAELLGLSGRAGTIEAGKMANLVVVDGELLVAEPKIEAVWIDGRRYETRGDDGEKKDDKKGRATEVAR